MRIVVMGPNLAGPADEEYHVHAAGCADIERSPLYGGAGHKADREAVYDFADLVGVAAFVYDFDPDPASLIDDFRVFPCAAGLPREAAAPRA